MSYMCENKKIRIVQKRLRVELLSVSRRIITFTYSRRRTPSNRRKRDPLAVSQRKRAKVPEWRSGRNVTYTKKLYVHVHIYRRKTGMIDGQFLTTKKKVFKIHDW